MRRRGLLSLLSLLSLGGCIVCVESVAGCTTTGGGSAAPQTMTSPGSSSGVDASLVGGGGATIDTASAEFPDLRTLWSGSIARTCGPNNGVCHDNKQFPDMQVAEGFLSAINTRCNQLRDDPTTIDNLCEPSGDVLQIGTFQTTIGFVTATPNAMSPTTVSMTLADPVPAGADTSSVSILRQRAQLAAVSIPIPAGAITLTAGSRTVTFDYTMVSMAPGPTDAVSLSGFLVPNPWTPGADDQVEQGDPNGDGVFGGKLGGALVKPGSPLLSYLFLRINGPLVTGPGNQNTNVVASSVVEQQMPLANYQYWDASNATLAIWCWISTMKDDASNADGPIDYAHCDTSKMSPVTLQPGEAVTYARIYQDVLQPSCAGPCHHDGTTEPTTFRLDDAQTAYQTLIGLRGTGPTESKLPFVTPADPTKSYLHLKISSAMPPAGSRMPPPAPLPGDTVTAIGTWISQGANEN